MFSRRLAEYLNVSSGIADIVAYAEAFPAPKATAPHTVGVISVGGTTEQGRTQFSFLRRFMVSGSADSAASKALEIFRHFYRPGIGGSYSREVSEYAISEVFAEDDEPHFASNNGNIFYATFTLRFLVSRDT